MIRAFSAMKSALTIGQPGGPGVIKAKYYPGHYAFGSTYNGGKFANPFNPVPLFYSPYTGNYVMYFMGNQAVYRPKAGSTTGLDAFFGFAGSPNATYNKVDKNITAGCCLQRPDPQPAARFSCFRTVVQPCQRCVQRGVCQLVPGRAGAGFRESVRSQLSVPGNPIFHHPAGCAVVCRVRRQPAEPDGCGAGVPDQGHVLTVEHSGNRSAAEHLGKRMRISESAPKQCRKPKVCFDLHDRGKGRETLNGELHWSNRSRHDEHSLHRV